MPWAAVCAGMIRTVKAGMSDISNKEETVYIGQAAAFDSLQLVRSGAIGRLLY